MVILSRSDNDQIICLKFPDWEPRWDPQSRPEDGSRAAGPWQRGEASVQLGAEAGRASWSRRLLPVPQAL